MPSREEIVEWLRETGNFYFFSAPTDDLCEVYEKKWVERAAQVSAMRCETCRYWHKAEGLRSDYCSGMKWNEVDKIGPDFGCFRHEQKPAG